MAGVERIIVSALVFSGCTEYGSRYYRGLNGRLRRISFVNVIG